MSATSTARAVSTARGNGRLLLRRIRTLIGNDPIFLPIVLRATPRGTSRRITDRTNIVVEGYPRSGNTLTAAALRYANGPELVVASHVHTPSQVVLAVRRSIPTVVVIRRPVDCVVSLLIAAPHVPPDLALREWIDHHRLLWQYRDRFMVATFEQTTADLGRVFERIDARFDLGLRPFTHDEDGMSGVHAIMAEDHERYHQSDERNAPWPTASRDDPRTRLLSELGEGRYRSLIDEANGWYERYAEAAV